MSLPPTCRALVCHAVGEPLQVEIITTPKPTPGSVVVKVEKALLEPKIPDFLNGKMPFFSFPTPFTPGSRAIGRVAATGPDTTALEEGQLVLVEPLIHARDDDSVQVFMGVFDGGEPRGKKLFADNWREGAWAEYAKVPLENCHALDEKLLEKYSYSELLAITFQLVGYGGLRSIDLKPGETIIVAPATGGVSGATVEVASAMGARVIAASRNMEVLKKLAEKNSRVVPYQLKGDVDEDLAGLKKFGKIDAYIDLAPAKATFTLSCFMALKRGGRACLMGGGALEVPYITVVLNNLMIHGRYMYEPKDVKDMIKMVEIGLLKVGREMGHEIVGEFALEDWKQAFAVTTERAAGQMIVFTMEPKA